MLKIFKNFKVYKLKNIIVLKDEDEKEKRFNNNNICLTIKIS